MSGTPPPEGPDAGGAPEETAPLSIESVLQRIENQHAAEVNRLSAEWRERQAESTGRDRSEPAVVARPRTPPPARQANPLPYYAVEPAEEEHHRARWIVAIAVVLLVVLILLGILFLTSGSSPSQSHVESSPPSRASAGSQTAPAQGAIGVSAAAATAVPAVVTPVPSPQASSRAGSPSQPSAAPRLTATEAPATVATPSDPVQRATAFQSRVRSGKLEVSVDYGGGTSSTADLSFDLGDNTHPPRLYAKTVYKSGQTSETSERTTIGDQSWERRPDGSWAAVPEQEGVWGRVQVYLPNMPSTQSVTVQPGDDGAHLVWSDGGKQNTLVVDQTTGTPRELRQQSASPQLIEVVKYLEWNTPVDIRAP